MRCYRSISSAFTKTGNSYTAGQLLIDGLALFEVPNFDMIIRHNLFNEFIPDHRCYFTKDTFRCLLSISGFEVVSMDEIWMAMSVGSRKKRAANNWSEMSSHVLFCVIK